jgi:hypothetical protein
VVIGSEVPLRTRGNDGRNFRSTTLKQISVEWMQNRGASVSAVIAGLDPAIHPFRKNFDAKKMDPRVKPAGDAAGRASTGLIRPGHALE